MSCRPQCFVPVFLCSIAAAVIIIVPIYYFVAIYRPQQMLGDFALPFESDRFRVEQNSDGTIMVHMRHEFARDYAITLELPYLGTGEFVQLRNNQDFLVSGSAGRVHFTFMNGDDQYYYSYLLHYYPPQAGEAQVCAHLRPNQMSWFGGPTQSRQYWPMERMHLKNYAYVSKQDHHGSVAERYWLNSAGGFIYAPEDIPLFVNQNVNNSKLCFITKFERPYSPNFVDMVLYIGIAENAEMAHSRALNRYLNYPNDSPDRRMLQYPIWSTWPRYNTEVNASAVLQLANEIEQHGFQHAQIEIGDNWEGCYGSLTFDHRKFPSVRNLTDHLRARGFRTTLWIHPFVNKECDIYGEAVDYGFFVRARGLEDTIQWWRSTQNGSALIDFTQADASKWFRARLKRLTRMDGIDSFSFDAGESSWVLPESSLTGFKDQYPTLLTARYAEMASIFGSMVVMRSAFHSQKFGIVLRMREFDSNWSWNNGFPNLITKLLQLNMVGYGFVLPGIIGGNAYDGQLPDKELFIRWVQANTFMPAMQFSYAPWDYDAETIAICKKFTELHAEFTDEIPRGSYFLRSPVNPPIWWIDPLDRTAHHINDEFMLGSKILVAPVLQKGQTSRHIYLPRSEWYDPNQNKSHKGPIWLLDYPAPLDVLPYFFWIRGNST